MGKPDVFDGKIVNLISLPRSVYMTIPNCTEFSIVNEYYVIVEKDKSEKERVSIKTSEETFMMLAIGDIVKIEQDPKDGLVTMGLYSEINY